MVDARWSIVKTLLFFPDNDAIGFGQYSKDGSKEYARQHVPFDWGQLKRLTAAQIATIGAVLRRDPQRTQLALNNRRVGLRSAQCDRAVTHRAAPESGGSRRALNNRTTVDLPIRSPPRQAYASP